MTPDPIYLPLSRAAREIYYGASCNTCRETRQIDLGAMADRLGPDFPTNELRPLLRCATCGGQSITVTTLYRSASTSHALAAGWK